MALYACYRLRRRLGRTVPGVAVPLLALLLVGFAGYWLWYFHRPQPGPVRRDLAPGVTYRREARMSPRPIVLHVVEIDLTTPGLEFVVTPVQPTGAFDLPARTTSRFAEEFDVRAAINAGYFYPFRYEGPFDWYPHPGEPVNVIGSATSAGRWYSTPVPGYTLLAITPENRVVIGGEAYVWNGVSGKPVLLKDGQATGEQVEEEELNGPNPRTAVGVNRAGTRMYWLAIDGRQPRFSEGVTFPELADLCRDLGCWDAIALDGGGSTTVVAREPGGKAEVLNCPIHGRHPPGVERPVGNHLGVRVRPR